MGEVDLQMFFESFSKCSARFTNIFFLHSCLAHLNLYSTPLFWRIVSLSFGVTRRSLMVLPSLKYIFMPCFMHMFLQFSFSHVLCICFYNSPLAPWCKAPLCECSFCCFVVGCSWCYWNSLWACLACCFLFWLCLRTNLDI